MLVDWSTQPRQHFSVKVSSRHGPALKIGCADPLSTSVDFVQKHGPSLTELAALIQKWLAVSEEWEASQQIAI